MPTKLGFSMPAGASLRPWMSPPAMWANGPPTSLAAPRELAPCGKCGRLRHGLHLAAEALQRFPRDRDSSHEESTIELCGAWWEEGGIVEEGRGRVVDRRGLDPPG